MEKQYENMIFVPSTDGYISRETIYAKPFIATWDPGTGIRLLFSSTFSLDNLESTGCRNIAIVVLNLSSQVCSVIKSLLIQLYDFAGIMIQLGQGSTGSTEIVFSLAACRTNVR
jgi:hypothetical protein